MRFEYQLDEKDYMNYLLYSTSKSKKVVKRRALNKILLMAMYFITGMFLWNKNGPVASAVFFVLCIPLYFLYSHFERKQYHKHFSRFIQGHYKEWMGKDITVDVEDDNIHIVDEDDTTLVASDIEWVGETGEQIIIQAKAGKAFIIPKKKLTDNQALSTKLKEMTGAAQVAYNEELAWKWK